MSGLITNTGEGIFANRMLQTPTNTYVGSFSFGTSATTPLGTDTDLNARVPISGMTTIDSCDVTTGWSASGTNSVSLNTTTTLDGVGALNMIKSDTTSATMSMSKTTTTLTSFVSTDFWCFVYISSSLLANLIASGTAVAVRFGTNSSNYYEWDTPVSSLAVGWNPLGPFNTANASSTTGSPGTSNLAYTYVSYICSGTGITSSAGDFIAETMEAAVAGNYVASVVAGYPIQTLNTLQWLVSVSSLQCNGFTLQEFGLKNQDGTPVLYSHDTFSPSISKNNTIEITVTQLDTIT